MKIEPASSIKCSIKACTATMANKVKHANQKQNNTYQAAIKVLKVHKT